LVLIINQKNPLLGAFLIDVDVSIATITSQYVS